MDADFGKDRNTRHLNEEAKGKGMNGRGIKAEGGKKSKVQRTGSLTTKDSKRAKAEAQSPGGAGKCEPR